MGLALLKTHERELLKLQGDKLADALRVLPTRAHDCEALMERAHGFNVSQRDVLGPDRI